MTWRSPSQSGLLLNSVAHIAVFATDYAGNCSLKWSICERKHFANQLEPGVS